MNASDKPLVWLNGEVKTPPFSLEARRETGFRLRRVQQGHVISMPAARPMPAIGPRCYELRVRDKEAEKHWRIIYRMDDDAIVIADVFAKRSRTTPHHIIERCKKRYRVYDSLA